MAIEIIGTPRQLSGNTAGDGSFGVSSPLSITVLEDDLKVVILARETVSTITPPEGFITGHENGSTTGNDVYGGIFYKWLAADETGTHTFFAGASEDYKYAAIVLRGVDRSNPEDVAFNGTGAWVNRQNDTSPNCPAVTTATNGAFAIACWVINSDTSVTQPGGDWASLANSPFSTPNLQAASQTFATAGTSTGTPEITGVAASQDSEVGMFVFRPSTATNVTVQPSALSVTSSVVAPSISGSVNFSPSTLSTVANGISPSASGEAQISVSVLSLTANLIGSSVSADSIFQASSLSLTANQIAPNILTDASNVPDTLSITASTQAPSISSEVVLSLNALSLSANVQAASFLGVNASVSVDVLSLTVSNDKGAPCKLTINVPEPAVVLGGDVTVSLNVLSLTTATQAVNVSGEVNIAAGVLSLTSSIQPPAISVVESIEAGVLSLTTSIQNPSVAGDANVEVNALTLATSTLAPSVSGEVIITTAALSATTLAISPSITVTSNATFSAEVLSLTASNVAPNILVDSVASIGALSLIASEISPSIQAGGTVNVQLAVLTLTANQITPSINTDNVFSVNVLNIIVSTQNPTISTSTFVGLNVLSLTVSTVAPSISVEESFSVEVLSLLTNTQAPDIVTEALIEVDTLSATVSTVTPSLQVQGGVTVTPAALTLISSELSPSISGDAIIRLPPYEYFNNYTEVDPNNSVTLAKTKILFDNLSKSSSTYVYTDKGVNYFGDFTHLVTINMSNSGLGNGAQYWSVSNTIGNQTDKLNANDGIVLYNIQTSGTTSFIGLIDYNTDSLDTFATTVLFTYYITLIRSGTTCTAQIYSDSERTVLVDTLSITCSADTFRYLYGMASFGGAAAPTGKSGYVENLDLGESGELTLTTSSIAPSVSSDVTISLNALTLDVNEIAPNVATDAIISTNTLQATVNIFTAVVSNAILVDILSVTSSLQNPSLALDNQFSVNILELDATEIAPSIITEGVVHAIISPSVLSILANLISPDVLLDVRFIVIFMVDFQNHLKFDSGFKEYLNHLDTFKENLKYSHSFQEYLQYRNRFFEHTNNKSHFLGTSNA